MTVVIVSKNWETDKTSNAWDLIKHMGFQSRIEQYVKNDVIVEKISWGLLVKGRERGMVPLV